MCSGWPNAYYRADRAEDYKALISQLAKEVTHEGSRSQLLMVLASFSREEDETARSHYQEVIQLNAHPFDVQKARSALYENGRATDWGRGSASILNDDRWSAY